MAKGSGQAKAEFTLNEVNVLLVMRKNVFVIPAQAGI
jgi:hypothetical protein